MDSWSSPEVSLLAYFSRGSGAPQAAASAMYHTKNEARLNLEKKDRSRAANLHQELHQHTANMGTKRKASSRSTAKEEVISGWDVKGGKLGPITTYQDVADSEDEFHDQRDKVMFDDGPDAKRRRKLAEEGIKHHTFLNKLK